MLKCVNCPCSGFIFIFKAIISIFFIISHISSLKCMMLDGSNDPSPLPTISNDQNFAAKKYFRVRFSNNEISFLTKHFLTQMLSKGC